MRRGPVLVLLALASGAMSVLLAVAVNVATGGTLPGRLAAYTGWAWPAVGALAVVTVGLAFWQQNLQASAPSPPAAAPAAAVSLPTPVPAELPERSARFAGRARELEALRGLVNGGARVIAIAGAAGVGKSALARHLALASRPSYPDGQLYARLRGAGSEPAEPLAVLARFLTVLGAAEAELAGDVEALAARLRTRLAGRRMLLFLDDAADERQVRPLLLAGEGCLTIVTSRPVLGGLAEAALYDLDVMGRPEATELLAALVGAERLAAEPAATDSLLDSCGYLPLAVGIAGSRLRARPSWNVATLAIRLADERHRLDELSLRDTEIRASFTTSYVDLAEPDRRVFRRLGEHPGSELTVGDAAALAGVPEREAAAALERLADVRLVEIVSGDRYWRHDLIRLFAAERLAAEETPADRADAFARLLDRYAEAGGRDWFARERENVEAMVRRGAETGEDARVWRLIDAVTPLLTPQVDLLSRVRFWTDALRSARALGDEHRIATAHYRLGGAAILDGAHDVALDRLGKALDGWQRLGDRRGEAAARGSLGDVLRSAGRHREAIEQYEESLRLCELEGLAKERADVLAGLGTLQLTRLETGPARENLEAALSHHAGGSDDLAGRAWLELLLGDVEMVEGALDAAHARMDAALALFAAAGDVGGQGYTLRDVGYLACEQGRYADAIRHHAESERLLTIAGLPVGLGMAQEASGHSYFLARQPDTAIDAYQRSIATYRRIGDRARQGVVTLKLAEVLISLGRADEASAARDHAETLLAGLDLPDADLVRAKLARWTAEP